MSDASATLTSVVTYLEMTAKPPAPTPPRPAQQIALMRAEQPTVSFYRYLYNNVGADWLWFERRLLSDDELAVVIGNKAVEIYVLYVQGVPAGYGELNRDGGDEIELAYFGLLPEFIGRGLGLFFLRWLVDQAWTYEPKRVWVHTCDLDHPNALQVYQKAGFTPYDREEITLLDPRGVCGFEDWQDPRHS